MDPSLLQHLLHPVFANLHAAQTWGGALILALIAWRFLAPVKGGR